MSKSSRLPNAPLAEVVFEMRWQLERDENQDPAFWVDPGYTVLARLFVDAAKRSGFPHCKVLSAQGPKIAHRVDRRFYVSPSRSFPLWQIGPAIFAANESSEYEWDSFKNHVTEGLANLLTCYPKMKGFPLRPDYLELRYIDIFDKELIGSTDLIEFVNSATELGINIPDFFSDRKLFGNVQSGRFIYDIPVRTIRNTQFIMDFGSGFHDDQKVVRLETKVITHGKAVPSVGRKSKNTFFKNMKEWLECAHGLISPYFKAIIKPQIMEKFQ